MKERPILFSGPMVRALLDGTKTQTRRIVKGERAARGLESGWHLKPYGFLTNQQFAKAACPYGQPGERLWVRETFKAIASGEIRDGYGEVRYGWAYQANAATRWNERPTIIHDLTGQPATGPMQFRPVPWKPSIHMPRRASRILLEITDVRVERLQDISEADALAEGINLQRVESYAAKGSTKPAMRTYCDLWGAINGDAGPNSWAANPWVWAVSFKVVKP